MKQVNINFINFEDFIVIHRQKLGSRALHEVFDKYLKQHYGLNDKYTLDKFSTKDFSFRNMFQFYISFEEVYNSPELVIDNLKLVNNNPNFYTERIPNIDVLLNSLNGTDEFKREYSHWYTILKKLADDSFDSVTDIVNKKYNKPIIFLYKSPIQYAVTSLIQDLDEVTYYSNIPLDTSIYGETDSDTHRFFKEFIFSEKRHISNLNDNQNLNAYYRKGNYKNLYVINWLQELKELTLSNSHKEIKYINIMIPKLLYHLLISDGCIGSHRTPWTSIIFPIIEGNKNIILVNLDEVNVNWESLFKSISNKEYNFESEMMIQSNIKEDSNKSVTSSLIYYMLNDNDMRRILYSYYSSDFLIYNFLKSDPRNYHLKK